MNYRYKLNSKLIPIILEIRKYYQEPCNKILQNNLDLKMIDLEIVSMSKISITFGATYYPLDGDSYKDFIHQDYIGPTDYRIYRDSFVEECTFTLGDNMQELSPTLEELLIDNIRKSKEGYHLEDDDELNILTEMFGNNNQEYLKEFSTLDINVIKDFIKASSGNKLRYKNQNYF